MRRKHLYTIAILLWVFSLLSLVPLVSQVEKARPIIVIRGTASDSKAPDRIREKKKYVYQDIEENQYEFADFPLLMDTVLNCSRPFVMIGAAGQLGNQMCEAAHMIALKLKYKVQVGIPKKMRDFLLYTFPNLPLAQLPEECLNRTDIVGMTIVEAENYIALNGLDRPILILRYPCLAGFYVHYRSLFRIFFRFHDSVQRSAERYRDLLLDKWRKKMVAASLTNETIKAPGDEQPSVIGVHVRRNDYEHHLLVNHGSKLVEPIYFQDAFNFARKRYGLVAFILVSDDLPWCRENIVKQHPDAVALDDLISRDEDLALMTLSDHLIFDMGTFALWGGMLAKGDVMYAANVSYDVSRPYESVNWGGGARYEKYIPILYRKPY